MNIKELRQIYYIDKEVKRCEENVYELEQAIGTASRKMDGMPHQKGGKSDPTAEYAMKLIKAKETLEGYRQALLIRKTEINRWLAEVDDPLLSQIVEYRCIRLYDWEKVADTIGGGNTGDSCRMYFNRYFKRRSKK